MSSSLDNEWAGMIARHLAAATEGGASLEAAVEQVAGALPEARRPDVALVARVVRDGRAALDAGSLARSPLLGLIELLEQDGGTSTDRARALHRFEDVRRELAPSLAAADDRLGASTAYITMLGIAFVLVLTVFWLYLLPQFAMLYESFGAELPALTKVLLMDGGAIALSMTTLLVVVVVGIRLFRRHASRRLQALRPFDPRMAGWPLVGPIVSAYNEAIFLAYVRVLTASGCDQEIAQQRSAALTGVELRRDGSLLGASFAIAAELGRSAVELDHQYARSATTLPVAFDRALHRVDSALKLLFAVAVGLLVIAMYLPIFKLGSVI
jgi:hypothetical protein